MSKILVVEKERVFRDVLCAALLKADHTVIGVSCGKKALQKIQSSLFDLLIIDLNLPDITGMEVINNAHEINKNTIIIIIAAKDTLETAINAMEGSAYYFLQKPFSVKELRIKVSKALEQRNLTNEINYLRHERGLIYRFDDIIGESAKIKEVFSLISKVSKSNSTILISGETGTGKELIAGAIHYNSLRAEKSFVKVNCAALPNTLLESELFGHEKGSFTGADKQRTGRCEQANEGTLFLDEVSEMSPLTQAKILRFLQEKEFERVGGSSSMQVDVRVIAATNKNLSEEIKRGKFREDLFFRLNVVNIDLPTLRKRRDDIPLLANYFLRKYGGELGKTNLHFNADTIKKMVEYDWPGNIRELENAIERAALLCDSTEIQPEDIWMGGNQLVNKSHQITLPPGGISLAEAEKSLIIQALEANNWIQKKAAGLLNISQRVINYKIKIYGIKSPTQNQA